MNDDESDRFPDELIRIYQETVHELYEFVSRRSGGSRELAEDVTQETYLRAATAWPRRGLPACPLAWLQTVGRNLLLTHYRRRQPERLDSADLDTVLGQAASDGAEAAALVYWGLARLKARHACLLRRSTSMIGPFAASPPTSASPRGLSRVACAGLAWP